MTSQVDKLPDKKINWQTVVNVKSSILFMSLNAIGLERKYFQSTLDIDYEFKTFYHFDNTIAYSDYELEALFNLISKKIQEEESYLFELPKRTHNIAEELLGFAREVGSNSDLKRYSDKKLEKLFRKYIERCANAFPLLLISIPVEIIVTGELEKYVRNKLKKESKLTLFEKGIQDLTQLSAKETYFQQDYRKLLEIGQVIQRDSKLLNIFKKSKESQILDYLQRHNQRIYRKLITHNKKYAWINMYGFRRRPFTLIDLVGKLKDVLEKDCKKTLLNLERKKRKSEGVFEKAIVELKIKGQLRRKVRLMPELVYLRTYRFDIFTLSAYTLRNLFSEIANRLELSIDELIHLTLWEISDVLLKKRAIESIQLKKRMDDHADIMIDGQFAVITDKKILSKLRKQKGAENEVSVIKKIKGTIAGKGNAKGPVKVVMNPTQVTKVEKGDVLVAPMTSPDFVIGMLKAVAIVTDHGGITCHAAIVSRELEIPCIVGTKIATKVFKDGDLVEVDAEKGVVRKLER